MSRKKKKMPLPRVRVADGWVLTACEPCGFERYIPPDADSALCSCKGEWTNHNPVNHVRNES